MKALKQRTKCQACGQKGHWAGDPECRAGQKTAPAANLAQVSEDFDSDSCGFEATFQADTRGLGACSDDPWKLEVSIKEARPKCHCRCGCVKRPGKGRVCGICSTAVGPGCCWDHDAEMCHECVRDQRRSDDEPEPEQCRLREVNEVEELSQSFEKLTILDAEQKSHERSLGRDVEYFLSLIHI